MTVAGAGNGSGWIGSGTVGRNGSAVPARWRFQRGHLSSRPSGHATTTTPIVAMTAAIAALQQHARDRVSVGPDAATATAAARARRAPAVSGTSAFASDRQSRASSRHPALGGCLGAKNQPVGAPAAHPYFEALPLAGSGVRHHRRRGCKTRTRPAARPATGSEPESVGHCGRPREQRLRLLIQKHPQPVDAEDRAEGNVDQVDGRQHDARRSAPTAETSTARCR